MSLIEVFLIGVGLSMDAFAVSVGKGLGMRRIDMRVALMLAVSFGLFQALMPVAGWFLASAFASVIQAAAHWVAFALLAIIGGKMLYDGIRGESEDDGGDSSIGWMELLMLSVATSIDAFAVGVTFAALNVSLMPAVAIIGVTTFAFSLAGVFIGSRFGDRYERAAGMLGGLILIAIGIKVLVEHLM